MTDVANGFVSHGGRFTKSRRQMTTQNPLGIISAGFVADAQSRSVEQERDVAERRDLAPVTANGQ